MFKLVSKFEPAGDQPQAIEKLVNGINNGEKHQVLLGATGTGKTITSLYSIKEFVEENEIFTVIAVPYKHLVSQWAEDVKEFFPEAAVHIVHGEIKNAETQIYASYIRAIENYKPIIVITTIKSFFIERYVNLYDKISFDKLLIVDEASMLNAKLVKWICDFAKKNEVKVIFIGKAIADVKFF